MRTAAQTGRIGELLVRSGLVTEGQLAEGLSRQTKSGERIVKVLTALGYLEPGRLAGALARHTGIPFVNIADCRVPDEAIGLVPREFAVAHEVFPVDRLKNLLSVAMVCPSDRACIEELERTTGLKVRPFLCTANDLREAIGRYYPKPDKPADVALHDFGLSAHSTRAPLHNDAPPHAQARAWDALPDETPAEIEEADSCMPLLKCLVDSIGEVVAEVAERERLRDELIHGIDEHLRGLLRSLGQPAGDTAGREHVSLRAQTQRLVSELQQERRREQAAAWRDIASLRKEMRDLARQYHELSAHGVDDTPVEPDREPAPATDKALAMQALLISPSSEWLNTMP
ncbi:MAG: hypothetical protein JXR94_16495 [Candidatus Hydrogenedentes bacterium]|nr:hypothetical protein [Candidatus Hydrogenedentota bacterium]